MRAWHPRVITGSLAYNTALDGVGEDVSCLCPTKNVPDAWWPMRVWGILYPDGKVGAYLNLQHWSEEVDSSLDDSREDREEIRSKSLFDR